MPKGNDEEMIQKIKSQQAKLTARLQRIQARRLIQVDPPPSRGFQTIGRRRRI